MKYSEIRANIQLVNQQLARLQQLVAVYQSFPTLPAGEQANYQQAQAQLTSAATLASKLASHQHNAEQYLAELTTKLIAARGKPYHPDEKKVVDEVLAETLLPPAVLVTGQEHVMPGSATLSSNLQQLQAQTAEMKTVLQLMETEGILAQSVSTYIIPVTVLSRLVENKVTACDNLSDSGLGLLGHQYQAEQRPEQRLKTLMLKRLYSLELLQQTVVACMQHMVQQMLEINPKQDEASLHEDINRLWLVLFEANPSEIEATLENMQQMNQTLMPKLKWSPNQVAAHCRAQGITDNRVIVRVLTLLKNIEVYSDYDSSMIEAQRAHCQAHQIGEPQQQQICQAQLQRYQNTRSTAQRLMANLSQLSHN